MQEYNHFEEFVMGLRRREGVAIEQLKRDFGPLIRAEIARSFGHSFLRVVFEPAGLCHRVFVPFLRALANGMYEVRTPTRLCALLLQIAHRRAADVRRHHRRELDWRAHQDKSVNLFELPAREREPWQTADQDDLLDQLQGAVSQDELELLYAHAEGQTWEDIGRARGESPDAARMKYRRLVERLRDTLSAAALAS